MAEKKPEIKNKISRREFLKDAGLVVGGATLGSIGLGSACSSTVTQTENSTVTVTKPAETITTPPTTVTVSSVPLKSNVIAWDATKCVACGRCMQACSLYHEGGTSYTLSAIKWKEDKYFEGWDGELPCYPFFCQQCSSPECYFACPLKDKALCIDTKTGARYINKANCTGCGICVLACPLSPARITVDPAQKKAIKCDTCKDRAVRIVAKFKVTNPGSGYTSPPTVTLSGGGGTGATAAAQIGAPVASITVKAGGKGYTSSPTVTIAAGGDSGARATATVTDGVVTAITVTSGGVNYTSVPTITISGGGGTGATATATLGAGTILAVFVGQQGTGYTAAPTVSISGGGGSGATATAQLTTGQVCIDVCDRGALSLVPASERI